MPKAAAVAKHELFCAINCIQFIEQLCQALGAQQSVAKLISMYVVIAELLWLSGKVSEYKWRKQERFRVHTPAREN